MHDRLVAHLPTVKPVSRIIEEFHLVSNSSESSTKYLCKFSAKSALQYEIAFNLTSHQGSQCTRLLCGEFARRGGSSPRHSADLAGAHLVRRNADHYIHAVSSESRNAVGRIEELLIGPKWTQMQDVAQKGSLLIH